MISSDDVYFSLVTIDNDLPSPAPCLTNSAALPNFLDNFLMECNLLDPDNIDIEIDDLFDGRIEGFDQAQSIIFDGELPNLLEQPIFSSDEHSTASISEVVETIQNDSTVIETSDLHAHSNFISSTQLYQTGQSLKLFISPYPFQRARYQSDLERALHYISTPGNNCIEFEMLNLRRHMPANTSAIMRITRTTIPYGPDRIVCCHPYPLWIKDEHAKVHHSSLLTDITDQIMNNQSIKCKNIIMQRLKQESLKKITGWPIYSSNQLDCNGFYSPDTNKPKTIIENYDLRYSVLHFQIFFVDENQIPYPTDLSCETTPIFEYENEERENLSAICGSEGKRQTKRRQQQKSNTVF
ncbi:unnamed protein product [Rotaria sordida]|uniref:Uncharacterized protein n=1 Tax=Rotaria sordida TaxID=392033 RepID=A0A814JSD5_9BILA|nr:unnamed protein product [Rotaria sordida]CAF1189202.1 unnamed protein product [Rotaria sordida]